MPVCRYTEDVALHEPRYLRDCLWHFFGHCVPVLLAGAFLPPFVSPAVFVSLRTASGLCLGSVSATCLAAAPGTSTGSMNAFWLAVVVASGGYCVSLLLWAWLRQRVRQEAIQAVATEMPAHRRSPFVVSFSSLSSHCPCLLVPGQGAWTFGRVVDMDVRGRVTVEWARWLLDVAPHLLRENSRLTSARPYRAAACEQLVLTSRLESPLFGKLREYVW